MIRPLVPTDVAAARALTWAALGDLDERHGQPRMDITPELNERADSRIAHLHATDPAGAWVAEEDGRVVGCALALVRDGMWFLSLLMVEPGHQGKGIGRQLLDASLTTATDRAWILATTDPAALRRYQRAGFALHPTLTAKGGLDRSLLPAVPGVRPGNVDTDADLVNRVAAAVRGAPLARDLGWFASVGDRLLVDPGKGYALLRTSGVSQLAATDPESARRLLWAALAEGPQEATVDWLAGNQQWAIDVCLEARLTLGVGDGAICLRGQPPMSPYLPSGAFG